MAKCPKCDDFGLIMPPADPPPYQCRTRFPICDCPKGKELLDQWRDMHKPPTCWERLLTGLDLEAPCPQR